MFGVYIYSARDKRVLSEIVEVHKRFFGRDAPGADVFRLKSWSVFSILQIAENPPSEGQLLAGRDPGLQGEQYLASAMRFVISAISDYQEQRSRRGPFARGAPSDPKGLFFWEIKKWCTIDARLEGGRDGVSRWIERGGDLDKRISYCKAIEERNLFPQSARVEETALDLLVRIRTRLSKLKHELKLWLEASSAREDFLSFFDRSKELLRLSIEYLHFIPRDTKKMPDQADFSALCDPNTEKLKTAMSTSAGRLIQALLSAPLVQSVFFEAGESLNPQEDEPRQALEKLNPHSEIFSLSGEGALSEMVRVHAAAVSATRSGFAEAFKNPDRLMAYFELFGLVEELAKLIKMIQSVYNFSGFGGDFLVYGLLNQPVKMLVQSFSEALNVFSEKIRAFHELAEGMYSEHVRSARGRGPWANNYRRADQKRDQFLRCFSDCTRILSDLQKKLAAGISSEEFAKVRNEMRSFLEDVNVVCTRWLGKGTQERILAEPVQRGAVVERFEGFFGAEPIPLAAAEEAFEAADQLALVAAEGSVEELEHPSEAERLSEAAFNEALDQLLVCDKSARLKQAHNLRTDRRFARFNKDEGAKLIFSKWFWGESAIDIDSGVFTRDLGLLAIEWDPAFARVVDRFGTQFQLQEYRRHWLATIMFSPACFDPSHVYYQSVSGKDLAVKTEFFGSENKEDMHCLLERGLLSMAFQQRLGLVDASFREVFKFLLFLLSKNFLEHYEARELSRHLDEFKQVRQAMNSDIAGFVSALINQHFNLARDLCEASFRGWYQELFDRPEKKEEIEGRFVQLASVSKEFYEAANLPLDGMGSIEFLRNLATHPFAFESNEGARNEAWEQIVNSVLIKCCREDNLIGAVLVLSAGADHWATVPPYDDTIFNCAAKAGATSVLGMLRMYFQLKYTDMHDENDFTVLHSAIAGGQTQLALVLMKAAPSLILVADIEKGWTPFHNACSAGNLSVLREMLAEGRKVSVNAKTKEGCTGLQYLFQGIRAENVACIEFLLDQERVDFTVTDSHSGDNLLHLALRKTFMMPGINTGPFFSAQPRYRDLCQKLLERHPELSMQRNKRGERPIDLLNRSRFQPQLEPLFDEAQVIPETPPSASQDPLRLCVVS